ncbi:hypothetical protein DC31_04385 [Microbacterium sp. CH12i]|uniref:cyclase family protein n=1 Tax=Microbacterium sp. CH12i TaxID=1479651 RepID=UPI0004610D9F|nr:cyclase family protein [Microbacterium sp. CH12i]KDA04867.1 hypothetical protein DC31_04385 [Microbacterium sp. CH12i]
MNVNPVPPFHELPFASDRDRERAAWSVWGADDSLGSINRIGPDQVVQAASLVRTGDVISLSLPLDEPDPGLFPERPPFSHSAFATRNGRDDKLDDFYLQGSSHWDGLRHIRYRQYYWGGRTDEHLDQSADLGIEKWAEHGMITRGVLLDVAGHLASRGKPVAFDRRFEITVELLEEVAAQEGVRFREGDILLVRTGWVEGYRAAPDEVRQAMAGTIGNGFECPGLESSQQMAQWLWDAGIAGITSDNPAVEVLPVDREKGFLHRRLIALQGMAVGELWWLRDLAEHSARTGRFEFLLVSAPLRLTGGVGSPANAYAVF